MSKEIETGKPAKAKAAPKAKAEPKSAAKPAAKAAAKSAPKAAKAAKPAAAPAAPSAQAQGARLTVNGKQYAIADFSQLALDHFDGLRLVNAEIKQLNLQLALARTAQALHQQELLANLPAPV